MRRADVIGRVPFDVPVVGSPGRVSHCYAFGETELFDFENPDAFVRSTVTAAEVLDETALKFGGR